MKFNIGTCVHQKQSNNENTYALVTGYTKTGKIKAIVIQDFSPKAVMATLTGWYPEPVEINSLMVPISLRQRVYDKAHKLINNR